MVLHDCCMKFFFFFLIVSYFIQIGSLKSGGEVDKRGTTKKKERLFYERGEEGIVMSMDIGMV